MMMKEGADEMMFPPENFVCTFRDGKSYTVMKFLRARASDKRMGG